MLVAKPRLLTCSSTKDFRLSHKEILIVLMAAHQSSWEILWEDCMSD
jgi:hypothetical protein